MGRICHLCRKPYQKSSVRSYHQFPEDVEERLAWFQVIGMPPAVMKSKRYLCSDHFKRTDFLQQPSGKKVLKRGALPFKALNMPTSSKKKALPGCVKTETFENIKKEQDDPLAFSNLGKDVNKLKSSIQIKRGGKVFVDQGEQTESINHIYLLKSLNTDVKLAFFTGIHHSLLKKIEVRCEKFSMQSDHNSEDFKLKLLFVLMKLKLNTSFKYLAMLFNFPQETCLGHFQNTLKLLDAALKTVMYYPKRDKVIPKLPKHLKKIKKIKILDSMEISHFTIKSYSNSKSNSTFKWIIGITPSGLIDYVSSTYKNSTMTNKSMVVQENFTENLDSSVAIMVDKGFKIKEECEKTSVALIRTLYFGHDHLSKEERNSTKELALVRVQIEKTLRKIQNYKIISEEIGWQLMPFIDTIMGVVVSLVNLSSPALANCKTICFRNKLYK